MRVVCISDTHMQHKRLSLPEGDVLIHAGDITPLGDHNDLVKANRWLESLPYKHKFFVPGNHDWIFQRKPERAREMLTGATLLLDEGVVFDCEGRDWTIYGTPWCPTFYNWAFMADEQTLAEKFKVIPDVDILVTHGPPYGVLDDNKGSRALTDVLKDRSPKLHVFGHIHYAHGVSGASVNAAICDDWNRVTYEPIVVTL
jgi:Icc-related predicted phosphoesterase